MNAKPNKPPRTKVNPAGIPDGLKQSNRWVAWRYEWSGKTNRWEKIPINCFALGRASTTAPNTWTSFSSAYDFYIHRLGIDGIGWVVGEDIVGIDLDKFSTRKGELQQIFAKLKTYTEVSPSGKGLRILCKGKLARPGNKNSAAGVEVYDSVRGRYLTITGNSCRQHTEIVDCQPGLDWLIETYFPDAKEGESTRLPSGDYGELGEVLALAMGAKNGSKFKALWRGDWTDSESCGRKYGSQSKADCALCSQLAYWLAGCPDAIDGAFRLSGLYRDKWDRADYRQHTITQAVRSCGEFYNWGLDARSIDRLNSLGLGGVGGNPNWSATLSVEECEAFYSLHTGMQTLLSQRKRAASLLLAALPQSHNLTLAESKANESHN